jgi:lipoprotein-anchoring transpeptidase ErfK/SrfK
MNQENPHRLIWINTRLARWLAAALVLTLFSGCAQMQFPSLPESLTGARGAEQDGEQPASGQDDSTEIAEQTEPEPVPEPQEVQKPGQLYEWSGDGRSITRIVIDTNEQKARFYDGSDQVGWTTIASGVSKHPTPRGEFAIIEKVKDKRSNLYGKIVNRSGQVIKGSATGKDRVPPGGRFVGANMPHFMRMTYDGIGMHAGPIPRPGQPASHGCIRMPKEVAAAVFKHAGNGTPVTVIGSGPDYGNYAERVARQQAEERARRAAIAAAAAGTPLDGLDAEIETIKRAEESAGSATGSETGTARQGADAAPRPAPSQSAAAPSRSAGGSTADQSGARGDDGAASDDGGANGSFDDTPAESTADGGPPSFSPPPPPPRVRSASDTASPDSPVTAAVMEPQAESLEPSESPTVSVPVAVSAAAPANSPPTGLGAAAAALRTTELESEPAEIAPVRTTPPQHDVAPTLTPQTPDLGPPAPPPSMRSANQPKPDDQAG